MPAAPAELGALGGKVVWGRGSDSFWRQDSEWDCSAQAFVSVYFSESCLLSGSSPSFCGRRWHLWSRVFQCPMFAL